MEDILIQEYKMFGNPLKIGNQSQEGLFSPVLLLLLWPMCAQNPPYYQAPALHPSASKKWHTARPVCLLLVIQLCRYSADSARSPKSHPWAPRFRYLTAQPLFEYIVKHRGISRRPRAARLVMSNRQLHKQGHSSRRKHPGS